MWPEVTGIAEHMMKLDIYLRCFSNKVLEIWSGLFFTAYSKIRENKSKWIKGRITKQFGARIWWFWKFSAYLDGKNC